MKKKTSRMKAGKVARKREIATNPKPMVRKKEAACGRHGTHGKGDDADAERNAEGVPPQAAANVKRKKAPLPKGEVCVPRNQLQPECARLGRFLRFLLALKGWSDGDLALVTHLDRTYVWEVVHESSRWVFARRLGGDGCCARRRFGGGREAAAQSGADF